MFSFPVDVKWKFYGQKREHSLSFWSQNAKPVEKFIETGKVLPFSLPAPDKIAAILLYFGLALATSFRCWQIFFNFLPRHWTFIFKRENDSFCFGWKLFLIRHALSFFTIGCIIRICSVLLFWTWILSLNLLSLNRILLMVNNQPLDFRRGRSRLKAMVNFFNLASK